VSEVLKALDQAACNKNILVRRVGVYNIKNCIGWHMALNNDLNEIAFVSLMVINFFVFLVPTVLLYQHRKVDIVHKRGYYPINSH